MRTIVAASLLCVILLAGCQKAPSEWKDLMSGTVQTRSMPTQDTIKVTFTDGGEFECEVFQLDENQVAIQPGLIYVVQCKLCYGAHYRFIQRTAEDQKPGERS